ETAAEVAAKLLHEACTKGFPRETLLNVNVPDCSRDRLKGVRVTRQSKRTYHDEVIAKRDPRGRAYFWIAGDTPTWVASDDSDYAAVMSGFVSVTPLHLDLTHHAAIEALADWNLELP
nr:5'/3'-nucleotidase SurE [Candidatus Latescibacterota bacterium]